MSVFKGRRSPSRLIAAAAINDPELDNIKIPAPGMGRWTAEFEPLIAPLRAAKARRAQAARERQRLADRQKWAAQRARGDPALAHTPYAQLSAKIDKLDRERGEEHNETLAARAELGNVLRHAGKDREAEALFRRVLSTRDRVVTTKDTDPNVLSAVHDLAVALVVQGRHRQDEAEPLLKRALAGMQKTQHPGLLGVVNNLAALYQYTHRPQQAEPLFRQVLDKRTQELGAQHPDTLCAAQNLGLVLQDLGRDAEAIPLFEQAAQGREAHLGLRHASTVNTLLLLAAAHIEHGREPKAEACLRKALKAQSRIQGKSHPSTIEIVSDLGLCLSRMSKHEQAEALLRRALGACRIRCGPAHPQTLAAVDNLAAALRAKGEGEERGQAGMVRELTRANKQGGRARLGGLRRELCADTY